MGCFPCYFEDRVVGAAAKVEQLMGEKTVFYKFPCGQQGRTRKGNVILDFLFGILTLFLGF